MSDHPQEKDPEVFTLCLDNSGDAVDEARALFDEIGEAMPAEKLAPSLIHRAWLAVHEWLANLIQHAVFRESPPEILLAVRPSQGALTCTVEDNSAGLDLHLQGLDENFSQEKRPFLSLSFPERGMGLSFIRACAHELHYERLDDGRHRLTLSARDRRSGA